MKRLIMFFIASIVFCSSVFASGKSDLLLINKTGSEIEEIIINDITGNKTESLYVVLNRNDITVVKIKLGNHYDIIMVDVKGHQYGVKNRRYTRDSSEQQISHSDYIYEGIGPFFRRIIGR